jgi:phospho-N-acetylmuramoyl-pentapeptide-transferase
MLKIFSDWLEQQGVSFPGMRLFDYQTSRILLSILLSLVISTVFGKRFINFLRKKQLGETVRDLGLQGETQKKGTPTMGGIIIIASIVIPTLLLANVSKVYVWLMLLCTIWMGAIGLLDDYLKIRAKKIAAAKGISYKKTDSDGLAGKFKIVGQVILGLIVGATLYFNDSVIIKKEAKLIDGQIVVNGGLNTGEKITKNSLDTILLDGKYTTWASIKTTASTVPFFKNNQLNYASWLPKNWQNLTYILYILVVIFLVTAVSNGANITDGLDGLATGVSAIIAVALGIFTYVSGNAKTAEYLNIMYIPNMGELSVFVAAFIGACIGFLWYNTYPAQVFMGDTGSLTLGGIIAALAIIVRKELLIPVLCFVFLVENLSVMIQVAYFKYTKRKTGEGKRIFLMSPLHHHYQKKGFHESKIAVRFWIITLLSVITAIATLKLR